MKALTHWRTAAVFRSRAAPLALVLLTGGCLSTEAPSGVPIDFEFTVAGAADGWTLGAADFPVALAAEVNAVGDQRALPPEISTTFLGLYQSATNVSGELFVFHKRFFNAPPGTYKVWGLVQWVSNYQGECTSGPGPAVVMKAGASAIEPLASPDPQGVYRMNINKGTFSTGGDFIQLGDIRNGLAGCGDPGAFGARSTSLFSQNADLTVDASGGFWMFVGTQSSFDGRHELFFTHFRLVLEKLP
jgi:hypothetical protein